MILLSHSLKVMYKPEGLQRGPSEAPCLSFVQGPLTSRQCPSLPLLYWHWASCCGSKIHQKRAFTHQLIHIPRCSSTMQLFTRIASLAARPNASDGTLYCTCVGLLVIKLVVMLLPNISCRAFVIKSSATYRMEKYRCHSVPHKILYNSKVLLFLAGPFMRQTGSPTLETTVFHTISQGD